MPINCSLCGTLSEESYIVYWALDMGKICKICFGEITQFPPTKIIRSLMSSEEKQEKLKNNLVKAREARSLRAKEKQERKAELRQMKRDKNPEKYDAIYQKRLIALQKARATRAANKNEKVEYVEAKSSGS